MKRIILIATAIACLCSCTDYRCYIDVAAAERQFVEMRDSFERSIDREAYLMSLGHRVDDILIYCGEGHDHCTRLLPNGFSAAYVTTEGLMDSIAVRQQRIISKDGRTFGVLYIGEGGREMSWTVLRRIGELAADGAIIGGAMPEAMRDEGNQCAFLALADSIWHNGSAMPGRTIRSLHRAAGLPADLKTRNRGITYTHRHLPDADIYRVTSTFDRPVRAKLKFRVVGREPLIWDPVDGSITPVTYRLKSRKTKVITTFDPGQTRYIIFCRLSDRRRRNV